MLEMQMTICSNSKQSVSKESGIYGKRWDTLHDGYFSDPSVAQPLIEVIKRAAKESHPTVVTDLGGGTGFILKELLKIRELSKIRMVNVDISPVQLSECEDPRIVNLQASVDQFTRSQFQASECRLLLIARSLLHYFGDSELRLLLQHIRNQLKKDEIFIHQSACFENAKDAECLNLLYKLMGIPKCYYTVNKLESMFNNSGFTVYDVCPAAKLQLISKDITERYQLSTPQRTMIQKEIERQYGQKHEVYVSYKENFTAWLHYSIFSCKAI